MLSERSRNVVVGFTMLAALVGLMVGILKLGGGSFLLRTRYYTVTVRSPNAYGAGNGNKVNFNGLQIGHISYLGLAPEKQGVVLVLAIQPDIDIPSNVVVAVNPPPTGVGTCTVNFSLPAKPGSPNEFVAPGPPLTKDGTATVQASAAETGLIPHTVVDQVTRAVDKLTQVGDHIGVVADDLHELLVTRRLEDFDKLPPESRTANISVLVQRLDRVTRAVDTLVGSPDTQQKFQQILSNIQDSSTELKTLLAHADTALTKADGAVDQFTAAGKNINAAATQATDTLAASREQILKTADRLATLLASLEKTTTAIADGKGTAGKLVNDPRLYDALLDLSRSLKTSADDLHLLLRQWQQEGVNMHLK